MTATLQIPPDPLDSPAWDAMVSDHLSGYPIVFDPSIRLDLPPVTEDQSQVPIAVDARKLGTVDEVIVLGDLNPFPLTLKVRPKVAPAYFALRMRVEQATAIRAAVRKDGQWHVHGRFLDASGGGCTAPPSALAKANPDDIGQMRGKVWRESADVLRVRLRIIHPMDTGLQKTVAYFINALSVADADGKTLVELEPHEPVAENPTLTLLVTDPKVGDHLAVTAKDTDGGTFTAKVPLIHLADMKPTPYREGRL